MIMTERPKYIDGNRAVALQYRCDIVQLKYDGWWCKAHVANGEITYFSETGRIFLVTTEATAVPSGVYIGEFMRGTQWAKRPERHGRFFVHDIWERNGFPADGPYGSRYRTLRQLSMSFPATWHVVQNYRIAERDAVWRHFVEGPEAFEGLVYRRSDGLFDATIVRDKRVITLDGIVVGMEEGDGKHSGRMGALKVQLKDGTVTSVGNGWSDDDREFAMLHVDRWIGKCLEFTCNLVFESGNVRHGRFVRWRDDKST
jgi:ATP-dependent DNA ligase